MILLCIAVPVIAAAVFVFLFENASKRRRYIRATAFKAGATACCILIALTAYFLTDNKYHASHLVLGLFAGMMGDVLLSLRFVFPKIKSKLLVAGAFSFFAGHLVYVFALYHLAKAPWQAVIPMLLISLIVEFFISVKFETKKGASKLFIPLSMYIATVCFMACYAIVACIMHFSMGLLIFSVGGICFVISDTMLTLQYFTVHASPTKRKVLHAFYWIAQALIASTAFII